MYSVNSIKKIEQVSSYYGGFYKNCPNISLQSYFYVGVDDGDRMSLSITDIVDTPNEIQEELNTGYRPNGYSQQRIKFENSIRDISDKMHQVMYNLREDLIDFLTVSKEPIFDLDVKITSIWD